MVEMLQYSSLSDQVSSVETIQSYKFLRTLVGLAFVRFFEKGTYLLWGQDFGIH